MTSLFTELRRRNVLRVAAAYAVGAWIIIEAGSVLLPTFGAPEWAFKAYVVVVFIGFLISLAFAWIFELTPEGVRLERDVDRSREAGDLPRHRLNVFIIVMLVVALGISVTLNITGLRHRGDATAAPAAQRLSIAVLPFTSLSADPDNRIFADGIHDDLLTRLANVAALKVISRTSVMEYRGSPKNLREIADELGVGTVLEGTVQRVGDSVRINAQLIDATTDEHLWADSYDRELSTQSIFQLQSEISEAITGALQAQLTEAERGRLAQVPTENFAAYNLYMQGRANLYQRTLDKTRLAKEQFEKAIELDPGYADAYAGLSDSLLLLLINHQALPLSEVVAKARPALEKAIEINPELADAFASKGLLLSILSRQSRSDADIEASEAAFQRAIELNPNHARAIMWFAGLREAQQRPEEAIELYQRSLELDPLARVPYSNLPGLYASQGDNRKALDYWLKGIHVHPDWPTLYETISVQLEGLGRLDESVAWARKARELSTDPLAALNIIGAYVELGDLDTANRFMDSLQIPEGHPLATFGPGFQRLFNGDYAGALSVFEAAFPAEEDVQPFMYEVAATAALLTGDYAKARDYATRHNPELADPAGFAVDRQNSDDTVMLAYILQQEGKNTRAAELLSAALPVVREMPRLGMKGHGIRDVQILTLLDRPDEALATLQSAIDEGFRGSIFFDSWKLSEDPYLGPIRDDARFATMLAEIEGYLAVMRQDLRQAETFGTWDELRARVEGT